jgi:uncharacterized protein involved in exopolysaccharide biosynthesis
MHSVREAGVGASQPDDLSLIESVDIVSRGWKLVVSGAIAAGLLALIVLLVTVPRQWVSTAILVVVPPGFASELRPQALTLQGYQKLLESDSVIAEARRRLTDRGVIGPEDVLRRGTELQTQIFVSRRAEETSLSPMVLASASGPTAAQAASIANTWVEVFLEESRELSLRATTLTTDLIEREYANAEKELGEAAVERSKTLERFSTLSDQAADRWARELLRLGEADGAARAAYRAETQKLTIEYSAEHSLEARATQLASLRESLADMQGEQSRVGVQRAETQHRLEAAKARLEQTPQLLLTRKAMSDEAIWREVAQQAPKVDWNAIRSRVLVSEEANPVYADLASELARLEVDLSALAPREAQLASQFDELAASIRAEEVALARDEAEAAKIQETRDSGLVSLLDRQTAEMAVRGRERDRELAAIQDEEKNALSALDRTLAARSDRYNSLSKLHNQAILTKAQSALEDVRVAAPAVAPHRAEPRRIAAKVGVATMIGAILGVLLAIVREARSRRERLA